MTRYSGQGHVRYGVRRPVKSCEGTRFNISEGELRYQRVGIDEQSGYDMRTGYLQRHHANENRAGLGGKSSVQQYTEPLYLFRSAIEYYDVTILYYTILYYNLAYGYRAIEKYTLNVHYT